MQTCSSWLLPVPVVGLSRSNTHGICQEGRDAGVSEQPPRDFHRATHGGKVEGCALKLKGKRRRRRDC